MRPYLKNTQHKKGHRDPHSRVTASSTNSVNRQVPLENHFCLGTQMATVSRPPPPPLHPGPPDPCTAAVGTAADADLMLYDTL
jgi:hypothetical protein